MGTASQFEQEIAEQPVALERLLQRGRKTAEAIAASVLAFRPRHVLIAARGTSDNAARYAQYLLGAPNRLPIGPPRRPSLFTLYEAPPARSCCALVIGVSQSGDRRSIAVLRRGAATGRARSRVTNEPCCRWRRRPRCPAARCRPGARVAATKTYTAQVLAVACSRARARGKDERLGRATQPFTEAGPRGAL